MFRLLLLAPIAGLILSATAASAQDYPPPPPPPGWDYPAPYATPPPPTEPLQTPGAYGHSNVTHAVEAPLHDLNLTRQKIPAVLLAAMADPYARVPDPGCRALDVRIADLGAALGPDFDQAGTTEDPSINGKTRPIALSLAHGAAESILPFNRYVSTLTGAQRHDALVFKAIEAGSIRRGYLKGLGEAHGCRPPDAPHHLRYPAPPIADTRDKPLYPIH